MPQIRSAVRQNAAEARDARARIARKKKAREAAQRRRDAGGDGAAPKKSSMCQVL